MFWCEHSQDENIEDKANQTRMSIPQHMLKDDSLHGTFKIKYTSKREAVLIFHLKYLFLLYFLNWTWSRSNQYSRTQHQPN